MNHRSDDGDSEAGGRDGSLEGLGTLEEDYDLDRVELCALLRGPAELPLHGRATPPCTSSNRPFGSLDGPCGPQINFFGLHEAGENQILRVQIRFLENTNFPLLNGSQIQNQEKIHENSKGWKNPRAQSPRILSVTISPEGLTESSTASEGSSSCSATLWVSDRSAAEVKAILAKVDRFQERCPGVNLICSAGIRSADQLGLKGMTSLLVMLLFVAQPMGVKAQPGGDDGGGFDHVWWALLFFGFVGYSVMAMIFGAVLVRAFERIRERATYMGYLLDTMRSFASPAPSAKGSEKGSQKGSEKGSEKGDGKGGGKFPGKHPSGRPWTNEEVDEYHNELFGAPGTLRRRRPSSASDGGPPRQPDLQPTIWEQQMSEWEPETPQGIWAGDEAQQGGQGAAQQDDGGSEGSHYYRDMPSDSDEFTEETTPGEWVPPHILRQERKGDPKGKEKGKGKGKGLLKGLQRPGELWRRYSPLSRSTTPSPGRQAGAATASQAAGPSGPVTPSSPGTIDHGHGDEEAPFLDGEPYDSPYEPSIGEDPPHAEQGGEDEEEEEQDPCRVLPTVDEEDEALFEQEPEPQFPPDPPPGPKAPPAAWLEAKGKGKGKPDTEEVDPMWQEILGIEDPPGSDASDDEPAEEQPGGDARGSADPDPAEPVLQPGPAEPLPEPGPARPADPEELPPGPEVYMAPTGTVYHRRRNCGKLRAARRIFPIPGCPQCSSALRQWQIAFVTQGHYHADRDCTHGRRDARQVPACVECGGLLFQ